MTPSTQPLHTQPAAQAGPEEIVALLRRRSTQLFFDPMTMIEHELLADAAAEIERLRLEVDRR